ncbi:methionyl-tRNA formyltransferase, mitochondrial [Leptinotarsa decemlineata]|uniref:methionyl-tRNA formyltransferase, mitochondrial n=1 Tax=Leptinotarsa decemlineata TaxID=7539 RepID=UPI003D304830
MKFLSNALNNIICNIKSARVCSTFHPKPPWNVLFFGTDEFSLYSLKALSSESVRGVLVNKLEIASLSQGSHNTVWNYAEKENMLVHNWPVSIENGSFHLGVVVSFGKLIPESIINKFPFGILNVHASLLPRWRGAAPIIYTLAKGDSETGITIMRIKPNKFDVGEIVAQERVPVPKNVFMPELRQRLGQLGAECLVKTLRNLPESLENARPQSNEKVTLAPKITPDFATIDWMNMQSSDVYNLYRALHGFLSPTTSWKGIPVKLHDIEECNESITHANEEPIGVGYVKYDKRTKALRIICSNRTCISVGKISVFGKKVMSASDFNNGYLKKVFPSDRYFR